MSIRTVYFDMGGTLLHYHPPGSDWQAMEKLGGGAVYDALTARGHLLHSREVVQESWWQGMLALWKSLRHVDKNQMRTMALLENLAREWAIVAVDDDLIAAEDAYSTAIQRVVRPVEGALDALKQVCEAGFRVGLISNTVWRSKYHQDDLQRFGFWSHFEHAIFSADALLWKPESDIFTAALAVFDAEPEQAVYVGDSLFFDVYGAQQAGWRAIWVEQPTRWMPPGMDAPQPDAILHDYSTLPAILEKWNDD
jgi:HAD superfamily hydrolase (TIGR01509 family)